MLPFSHLSLHYNRKIGTVVDVIIWEGVSQIYSLSFDRVKQQQSVLDKPNIRETKRKEVPKGEGVIILSDRDTNK
jgi:hypothetical protein